MFKYIIYNIMKLFENIKDWWNSFLDDYHQSSTDKLINKINEY